MAGKLKQTRPTRRDADDAAVLKHAGAPAHINEREDRLLASLMPHAHGEVVTSGLLADAGRRGDDRVTRLTPAEAALLKSRGGAGTRNPLSGLLEYSTAGGGGGEGGDNGVGGPGNGSEGTGPGQSYGGMDVGGNTSFSNWTDDPTMGPMGREDSIGFGGGSGGVRSSIGYGLPARNGRLGGVTSFSNWADDPTMGPMGREDQIGFAANQPDWNEYDFVNYAPKDTLRRALQEWWDPSLPQPGRFEPPDKYGPGILGTVLSQLAGKPFSAAMGIGGAMGRASSKATQEASAAEDAGRSAHNSTGNQGSHSVLDMDAQIAALRGTADTPAAETIGQAPPPGYTLNPAGQIVPLPGQGGDNRPAWKDPVQNLIADYIWRGPSGRGWSW